MATDWNKLQPFYVGVPHQRRPFIVSVEYARHNKPPEPNDQFFEGDHDLHGVEEVMTPADAEVLMDPRDPDRPGGMIRHQAAAIAVLVRRELESQGVLEPDEDEETAD